MTYADAVAALERRSNYERSGRLTAPTIERIAALMDLMGEPQRAYPSMHITGTVGKSTTARAATELLRAAGLSVGTYLSPHVESVRERFLYDGHPIDEDAFTTAWDELSPYLDVIDGKHDRPLTWFEATTALAFSWFTERGVDVAVVEVGMGGTWDATNVIDASVAVITPIGLDHADVLGPGLAEIAREKAGIIKHNAIAYSAAQDQGVFDVLRARCEETGAGIRAEGLAFDLEEARLALSGQQLTFRIDRDRYQGMFLPMFGEHIARDAVLGLAAARAMLGEASLEPEVVQEALAAIRSPGRMEVVRRRPLVVLDGAHNGPGAEALARAMPESFRWQRLTLIVSVMDDKDIDAIVAPLARITDEVIVTRNASPRAADPDRLAEVARSHGTSPTIVPSVADAISVALERNGEGDCILVTGSLYTVGDARPHLVG